MGRKLLSKFAEFFRSGQILKHWNATTLALIPKYHVLRITDFWPILCFNTMYKVISNLLAGRLQNLLPSVISQSQSLFIPGTLMVENVLLATKMLHGYKWKNLNPKLCLSLIFRKLLTEYDGIDDGHSSRYQPT